MPINNLQESLTLTNSKMLKRRMVLRDMSNPKLSERTEGETLNFSINYLLQQEMIDNLFAAYYKIMISLKSSIPEYVASNLVVTSFVTSVILILFFLGDLHYSYVWMEYRVPALFIVVVSIILAFSYFLRKGKIQSIVDRFEAKSALSQNLWKVYAAGIIIVPLLLVISQTKLR